jgi:hypothetical protein
MLPLSKDLDALCLAQAIVRLISLLTRTDVSLCHLQGVVPFGADL